jgi:large subunit ribosomal protein L18
LAKGPRYRLPFRRRREGKTDYRKRKALILSGLPRLVVRPTLKNIYVQVVETREEGDRTVASACSKELVKFNWRGGTGNVPAAYLTGLLAGKRAMGKGISRAVLDIGPRRATAGSRAFAALKGALDAGLEIPHGEEILPQESRIRGEHIASYAKQLLESKGGYCGLFSIYLKSGLEPERLPEQFDRVKGAILAAPGESSK